MSVNEYFIHDTSKVFNIWFSNKPNVFMPMRNQLRLINLIESNPEQVAYG